MKAILRSIKPYWLYLILTNKKKIEVGKNKPNLPTPFTTCLYCSKDKNSFNRIPENDKEWFKQYVGKVACEFVCNKISHFESEFYAENDVYQDIREVWFDEDLEDEDFLIVASNDRENLHDNKLLDETAMTIDDLKRYIGYGCGEFYGWHISDLKIYDEPKEISEFQTMPCEKSDNACESCKYRIVSNTPEGWESECYVENGMTLTRPPQSWCYVESLEDI